MEAEGKGAGGELSIGTLEETLLDYSLIENNG